jgi:hypothetical protein
MQERLVEIDLSFLYVYYMNPITQLQKILETYLAKKTNKQSLVESSLNVLVPCIDTKFEKIFDAEDLLGDLFRLSEHYKYPDVPVLQLENPDEVFEEAIRKIKNLVFTQK